MCRSGGTVLCPEGITESTSVLASKHTQQERKNNSAEERQRHPHRRYLVFPAPALAQPHAVARPALFSLCGSTNHCAMSSLCQGLDFISSHMIGLGCCGGLATLAPQSCAG